MPHATLNKQKSQDVERGGEYMKTGTEQCWAQEKERGRMREIEGKNERESGIMRERGEGKRERERGRVDARRGNIQP